jgi:hypothetical protein
VKGDFIPSEVTDLKVNKNLKINLVVDKLINVL